MKCFSLCSGIATGIVFWGIAEPITHFTPSAKHWFIITVAIVITFIIGSVSGIGNGVRWLSDKNAKIYMLLLVYVFFCAQTKEILTMGTEPMGFFAQNWIVQNTYLGAMAEEGAQTAMWPTWWTINYWSFMIAYAPLTGEDVAAEEPPAKIKIFWGIVMASL